jgi:hypothetical protein
MRVCTAFATMYLALVLAGCSGAMSPNGDAGENQTVTLGETVTLDGKRQEKRRQSQIYLDHCFGTHRQPGGAGRSQVRKADLHPGHGGDLHL